MARLFVLALAVVALAAPAVLGISWTSCGTTADHLHVSSIQISPETPVAGGEIAVTIDGTLDEPVNAGTVSLQFLWGHVAVANKDMPLCGAVGSMGATCPVPAGAFSHKSTFTLPQDIPHGSYTGKIRAVDENNEEILCLSTLLKF
eukprot:a508552_2180.p1 GENE.a508552_2180~~a508552_2180.p1  ORF type:complete len:157 (+),score=66.35 a508552_2180:36-473(+)